MRARTAGAFDPQQPLSNRFIHCWLKTWGKRSAPQAAVAAEASDIGKAMHADALAESKRLLYVGLTRARDMNVLVSFVRKSGPGRGWVEEIPGAAQFLFGATATMVLPGGQQVARATKSWAKDDCAAEPPAQVPQDRHWFVRRPRATAKPLWHRPSSAAGGQFSVVQTEAVGVRIALAGKPDMANLGTALHLCLARSGVRGKVAPDEVDRILSAWGVAKSVDRAAVIAQLTCFQEWLHKRWPGSPVLVEVPIETDGPDGTRVRGRIDLLVETPRGWVLVDHKANPGGSDRDDDLAQAHGPQLASYAGALLAATGKPVVERWLYLPVAARAVRFS